MPDAQHNPLTGALPVTLVGGYLGAGKTTVVNHLLRHAQGRRLAVLVNEFGALPIDEDLIEAEGDDLISIAGGCICCSFGSDLTAALLKLANLQQRPDHVVIECSGVALPGAIAASISLIAQYRHDGTVVLLDAETGQDQLRDDFIGDTIQRQINDADLILLTKSDLADAGPLQAHLEGKHCIPITKGAIDPGVMLGLDPKAPQRGMSGHADALFDSTVLPCAKPLDPDRLCQALTALGLTRAKGFFTVPAGTRAALHIVGARCEITPAPQDAPLGIVCIGFKGQFAADACHTAARKAETT